MSGLWRARAGGCIGDSLAGIRCVRLIVGPIGTISVKEEPVVGISPKQARGDLVGTASWYPYYAGFSTRFAEAVLDSAKLDRGATVLDLWNGAGTTTSVAGTRGFEGIGSDLNPAMAVAARARLLSSREEPSLQPLAMEIIAQAKANGFPIGKDDPLLIWLIPQSCRTLRNIEAAVQRLLVGHDGSRVGNLTEAVTGLSDLAAFFYVALFRTVRQLMGRFVPSNPTWTMRPRNSASRLRTQPDVIYRTFLSHVMEMTASLKQEVSCSTGLGVAVQLLVADSAELPVSTGSVDLILSSPPYCTRIDYAVATMPELAVLGFHPDGNLQDLRRRLIGTATVPHAVDEPDEAWGDECLTFLRCVANHPSKASSGYYYKSHVQYFAKLYRSLREIVRVLSANGRSVLVVQDSFYKDIHNDVPAIVGEMLAGLGMKSLSKITFPSRQHMANIHRHTRQYRESTPAAESVLVMSKGG
jgi:DNA modification methylase